MTALRRIFALGLKTKLTMLIESLIIIIVFATGIITTFRETRTLENELYKRGLALASDLAKFTASSVLNNDLPTLRRFVNHSMKQDYVRYAMIADPQGTIIMHSDLSQVGKQLVTGTDGNPRHIPIKGLKLATLPEQSERHCDLSAPIELSGAVLGTVFLGYSYMAVEQEIASAGRQIVAFGLVAIVLGGFGAYILASLITSPLRRIIQATEHVARGNLTLSLTIRRKDEIGILAESFNKMAEELARHRSRLQNLVVERTRELENANKCLTEEIDERKRTQDELRVSRERLRKLALHIQYVREEEAKRIAREIHDELGQAMTALKFDLHWMDGRLPDNRQLIREKIDTMSQLIDATIKTVRRISSELRPGILDDFGLSAAMEWQTREFSGRTGISCAFASGPETIVTDQDRSVALFRIFQETLTNIARHAHATEVNAMLTETSKDIRMRVSDNGKGITENQIADPRSFGVIGMHERVHYLGGELKIYGSKGRGTTVEVSIPKGENVC